MQKAFSYLLLGLSLLFRESTVILIFKATFFFLVNIDKKIQL